MVTAITRLAYPPPQTQHTLVWSHLRPTRRCATQPAKHAVVCLDLDHSVDGSSAMRTWSHQDERRAPVKQHSLAHPGRSAAERDATMAAAMVTPSRDGSEEDGRTTPSSTARKHGRSRRQQTRPSTRTLMLSLLSASPALVAADCISMQGSSTCKAFQGAKISTDSFLVGLL